MAAIVANASAFSMASRTLASTDDGGVSVATSMPSKGTLSDMRLSDITAADLETVLALNEASVPHVNSIDLDQMRWFASNAFYFRVARVDEKFAGFLIGLGPGLDYGSENYRWFCDHYGDFGYVDRVAVDKSARRLGVASRLYDDFADELRGDARLHDL